MIIKRIEESYDDYEYDDYDEKIDLKVIKKISNFLENYDSLSNEDFYNTLCCLYKFRLEKNDYLEYINFKTGNNFNKIVNLKTDVIKDHINSEGHGRDFSWWTVKLRLMLRVAINDQFDGQDKEFSIDEIKQLILDNKIYPLYYFNEECSDKLDVNKSDNIDINFLISSTEYGQMNVNCEYFNYFVNIIRSKFDLSKFLIDVRSFIVDLKLNITCKINDQCYYMDSYYLYEEEEVIDNLIDCYNQCLKNINKLEHDDSELMDTTISKNSVDIIVKYISRLPFIDYDDWYDEISLEQIIGVIGGIDYEEEEELCDKIEQMIIDLGEPELCYEMASSVCWADLEELALVVIDSGDLQCNYDFAINIEDSDFMKHAQVIIDSENAEYNYLMARHGGTRVNIREHGKAVINSGSVWYNYLFANDIKGADIEKHFEVIISSDEREKYENDVRKIRRRGI